MDKPLKNPFTIAYLELRVFYYDDNGKLDFFSADTFSSESLIESLGRIERKIDALKKQHEVENDAKAMTTHDD